MSSENSHEQERITTALLLAAGTGSRLLPLTNEAPKCLTLLNEVSILGRLIENLKSQGFKRLVVVTGHLSGSIENFLDENRGDMVIEYVHSPLYKTTNNIYSLWMARDIIKESFVLFESDLVFDHSLLDDMMYPDRIAVAGIEEWMNGTTVILNSHGNVIQFKDDTTPLLSDTKYKTVNIYSFSHTSWLEISKRLDRYIKEGNVNGYYEIVFSELVDEDVLSFKAVSFDKEVWYEIDTICDLEEAAKLFPTVLLQESVTETLTYGAA